MPDQLGGEGQYYHFSNIDDHLCQDYVQTINSIRMQSSKAFDQTANLQVYHAIQYQSFPVSLFIVQQMGNSAEPAIPGQLAPQSKLQSQHDYFEQAIVFSEYPFRIEADKLKQMLHRSVGALTFLNKNKKINAGSAALISKDAILTCAHNLYDKYSDSENTEFKFYIGADGVAEEYYEAESWKFPSEFRTCQQSNKLEFDYGIMKLKRPVLLDDYLPLSSVCPECMLRDNQNLKVMIYGFPLFKENFMALDEEGNKLKLYQYGLTRKNRIIAIDALCFKLRYSISTLPGQSGCPVAVDNKIVAVHVGGDMAESNLGRIVDAALIRNLNKWTQQLKATPFKTMENMCMHKQQVIQSIIVKSKPQQPNNSFRQMQQMVKLRKLEPTRKKTGFIDDGYDYMSSSLQCISHVKELVEYFINKQYVDQINQTNPLGTKGELSTVFVQALQGLFIGTEASISLIQLRKAIQKFQPIFAGSNRHDSRELIEIFLDGLHEDLNRVKEKPYVEYEDYDGRPDQIVARQAWSIFLKRNQSIIVDLLYGQYKSIMECPKCQFQSISFDPFINLSLPLIGRKKSTQQMSHISEITIESCFKFFHQPEILDENCTWYCPKCKDFVLAKKQMFIYKAPKILIITLKRFMPKTKTKHTILVSYPIRGLDLSSYVLNLDLPQQQQSKGGKPIYDLISVSNHVGIAQRGHYTAYCKDIDGDEWYEFDGSNVSRVKDSQVVSSSAYVLFYRRRD